MNESAATNPLPIGERDRREAPGRGEARRRGKTPDILLNRSRSLRQDSTEHEQKLWNHLRAGRLHGWKFRRQVPVGPYIADFVCPAAKLIVELDGGQHGDAQTYDQRRDAFLSGQGYRVLRVWNNDVLGNMNGVLEAILAELLSPLPGAARLSLSPVGRG